MLNKNKNNYKFQIIKIAYLNNCIYLTFFLENYFLKL